MRNVTLCFLFQDNKICLAKKKRGFGVGKYNGVGGKVEEGESATGGAVRELYEEVCVRAEESSLEPVADITFIFSEKEEWNQRMFVFKIDIFEGVPVETDEMDPKWFSVDDIPYENMWIDDPYWLPLVLAGKRVKARFVLSSDGSALISKEVKEVEEITYEN
ncbi:MAG: 8-oxo-dGTP diphosphatase [Candidatus Paceibacterota bacterium]